MYLNRKKSRTDAGLFFMYSAVILMSSSVAACGGAAAAWKKMIEEVMMKGASPLSRNSSTKACYKNCLCISPVVFLRPC